MSLQALRTEIAGYFTGDTYQVFSYPVANPIPNSIIIVPDDPYYEVYTLGIPGPVKVRFRLVLTVPALDNQGNLAGLEDLIETVLTTLPADIKVLTAARPSLLETPSGTTLLSTDLSIEVLTQIGA